MYGKNAEPPEGIYTGNGTLIPDQDGGIARLRVRNEEWGQISFGRRNSLLARKGKKEKS